MRIPVKCAAALPLFALRATVFTVAVLGWLLVPAQAQVNIALSTIGNPGNAADPSTGYGSVGYTYDIGTYDVTISQYATFLNDVAQSDPCGLYDSGLETDGNIEGITQSGVSGSYTYAVIGSSGNDPVTYVSWFDAARFINWLQNGQPVGLGEVAGSTETGAYTLNGATSGIILKNANATWWIPSENEWYKAAYYDPTLNGGAGGYWKYATRSNTAPGNVVGSLANQANYYTNGVFSATQSGGYSSSQQYLTPVGAFTNSASGYGTYDQNGDVWNWNDAVYDGAYRGLAGGSWGYGDIGVESSYITNGDPALDDSHIGFRVATIPEPGTWALLSLGAAGLLLFRSRHSRPAGPQQRKRR